MNDLIGHNRLSDFTVANALASIFWMDENGQIHFANETAQKQYGYSFDEFVGMNILDINKAYDLDGYRKIWERAKVERHINLETSHYNEQGESFPVEVFINHIEFEGKAYNVSFVLNISSRKRKERLLKSLSIETATTLGKSYFEALSRHISESLNVYMVLVTVCANSEYSRLRTLASFIDGSLKENISYDVAGTPCESVIVNGESLEIESNVQELYPREDGIEGYYGIPITSDSGRVLGHIGLFHNEPLQLEEEEKEILKIFSERTSVEIERDEANEKLIHALNEVELLKNRLEAENDYLQEEIKLEHNFQEIITRSEKFKSVLSSLEQVAITDATVLVSGESGTGKELLARAIHNISKRNDRPLVKVNCAALPTNLIESELFGHEKGAFTGAVSRKIGRFELADGGTLFLDEIGELPLELQSKLLRALQEGEFERVGSVETQKVDVRVIAATNRELEDEVAKGGFRADLYYRLNVFPIASLPLRERKEDIPLLVKHFVDRFSAKAGNNIKTIPKRVISSLQSYDWPGNIRELENVVERSVILTSGHSFELGDWIPKKVTTKAVGKYQSLAEFERKYILEVLHATSWRVSGEKGAAKILEMRPTTLESRMKKLGIKRGDSTFLNS